MYRECVERQTPPNMEPGDVTVSGTFFRNLKKEHVTKRYAGDDDENPRYGLKLHKRHWKYAEFQRGGLSVNLRSCIHSPQCSIALQPGGADYFHVATIDLQALNECALISSPFVAQYRPAPEFDNRCHFEIMPKDGTVLKWMTLGALLDSPFPVAKKLPATYQDQERAAIEYDKYRSYFDIQRWVRNKDGTLRKA